MADRISQRTRLAIAGLSFLIVGLVMVLVLRTPGPTVATEASVLPSINALLNGTAALLLSLGFVMIRQRRIEAHRICMTTAVVVSSLFLITYVAHHYQVGSVRFAGPEWLRPIYLSILIPHIVLSALLVPLALTTLVHAWRGRFASHRRIARWTLPIWMYVSVSGVVVYVLLYHS
jgi:uncharacterized membrane protein YozB (DUF420 family)